MGYVISGFVRRGGGPAQEAHWTGRAWAKKKAKIYPTRSAAEKAVNRIDVGLVESIAIGRAPAGRSL